MSKSYTTLAEIQQAQPGYLSKAVAKELCPLEVTIKKCEEKTFGQGASAETSIALEFVETNKYMTLSKTHLRMLGDVVKAGDPLVGQKIRLVLGEFDTGRGLKEMVGIVAPE